MGAPLPLPRHTGLHETEVIPHQCTAVGKAQGVLLCRGAKRLWWPTGFLSYMTIFLKCTIFLVDILSQILLRLVKSTGSPDANKELVFGTSCLLQRLICCYACQRQMSARAIVVWLCFISWGLCFPGPTNVMK